MIHAIAYILFILPFTTWLGFELKRKYSLRTHWSWIAGAFIVGIIGGQIYRNYPDMLGNFLLHASGGVASTLLFIYLCKTLTLKFNWRLTILLLFAFVSSLGVLNELGEYALELMGHGPYSFDSHDTWRDLVANTAGSIVVWTLYKTMVLLLKSSSSPKNSK